MFYSHDPKLTLHQGHRGTHPSQCTLSLRSLSQLFDELVISASGTLIRMPEISSRLTIGDNGLVCHATFHPVASGHRAIYLGYLAPSPHFSRYS